MSDKEIIVKIKFSLKEMAFKDIEKASKGGSKMGAFILASCFIDCLAGFRYGRQATGKNYRDFVKEYMTDQYNPIKLYKDLRCKLVHNYSEGGSYMFVDGKPQIHQKKTKDNKTVLNLECFLHDLKAAMTKYFLELDSISNKVDLAIKRFKKIGLLGIYPIKIQKNT